MPLPPTHSTPYAPYVLDHRKSSLHHYHTTGSIGIDMITSQISSLPRLCSLAADLSLLQGQRTTLKEVPAGVTPACKLSLKEQQSRVFPGYSKGQQKIWSEIPAIGMTGPRCTGNCVECPPSSSSSR
eukprot:4702046-Amphidinium_carterae.1